MKYLQKYIDTTDLPIAFKAVLLDKSIINRHNFYINLTKYFKPNFNEIPTTNLIKLTGSSYLYFKFLLFVDDIIDKDLDTNESIKIFHFIECFEQAMKDLSCLFPMDSPFWNSFQKCKFQLFKTVKLEKQLSYNSSWDDTTFEEIAIGKSAVCYAIIHAMEVLNQNPCDHKNELISCLENIHIAFQYRDDIDDFLSDLKEKQPSYAQFLVKRFLKEHNLGYSNPKLIYNALFVSRIAESIILKSIDYYLEALFIAKQYKLDELQLFLQEEIKDCQHQIKEINLILKKTKQISTKSNVLKNPFIYTLVNQELINCSQEAESYLFQNLNEDKFWEDFVTTAGTSTLWTTAYVGLNLLEANLKRESLIPIAEKLKNIDASLASYNNSIFQDGDSTNFLVGFTNAFFEHTNNSLIENWLQYQAPNGGWRTYNNAKSLAKRLEIKSEKDVKGWISPKPCVSAVAAYVLASMKGEETQESLRKTLDYLITQIDRNGFIPAYWWTSPVYSTCYTIRAIKKINSSNYRKESTRLIQWLIKEQHIDGYWIDDFMEKSTYYTALALITLMEQDFDVYSNNIQKGIKWILKNQMEDGSWLPTKKLKIPAPNVENPLEVTTWRKSSLGTNIIVEDHNRVFTTSTVVNALKNYTKHCNQNIYQMVDNV